MPKTASYVQPVDNAGYFKRVTTPSAIGRIMDGEMKVNGQAFRAVCYPEKQGFSVKLMPLHTPIQY